MCVPVSKLKIRKRKSYHQKHSYFAAESTDHRVQIVQAAEKERRRESETRKRRNTNLVTVAQIVITANIKNAQVKERRKNTKVPRPRKSIKRNKLQHRAFFAFLSQHTTHVITSHNAQIYVFLQLGVLLSSLLFMS